MLNAREVLNRIYKAQRALTVALKHYDTNTSYMILCIPTGCEA